MCIVIHLRLKEIQHGGEELPLSIQLWCSGSTCSMSHPLMTPHVLSQVLRATDPKMSECIYVRGYLLLWILAIAVICTQGHLHIIICIATQTTMPHL